MCWNFENSYQNENQRPKCKWYYQKKKQTGREIERDKMEMISCRNALGSTADTRNGQ